MRSEKSLDVVTATLDGVKDLLGCQKVTIFPIDYYVVKMTTKNMPKDKQSWLHTVQFQDENENTPVYIAALARSQEELCTELVFKSLRNLHEELLITNKGKKMGILIK